MNNFALLQGVNWFGFNNGQTMLDGLWAGYTNATLGDFPTVLKRIKLLGFNGLRLPFTFQDLDRAPTQGLYVSNCRVSEVMLRLVGGATQEPPAHLGGGRGGAVPQLVTEVMARLQSGPQVALVVG